MSEKEKKIMIVQDQCGFCKQAEEVLKDPIKNGQIEVIDADSYRGKELVKKFDLDAIPVILEPNDKFDNGFQKCYLSEDGKKAYCEDGSQKEMIKDNNR